MRTWIAAALGLTGVAAALSELWVYSSGPATRSALAPIATDKPR